MQLHYYKLILQSLCLVTKFLLNIKTINSVKVFDFFHNSRYLLAK